jgi:hypothetical protein
MGRFKRQHGTAALVISLIALVAAISGVAAASTTTHSRRAHMAKRGRRGPRGFPGRPGVVPQIQIVESPSLTLQPGESSVDAAGLNWQATCPGNDVVLGTGFDGPFPESGGFVEAFGTLVGGFFANESSIPISDVKLEAICGAVPQGSVGPSADTRSRWVNTYHAKLAEAEARLK